MEMVCGTLNTMFAAADDPSLNFLPTPPLVRSADRNNRPDDAEAGDRHSRQHERQGGDEPDHVADGEQRHADTRGAEVAEPPQQPGRR